jgi:endo-1,4-beta-xylanase
MTHRKLLARRTLLGGIGAIAATGILGMRSNEKVSQEKVSRHFTAPSEVPLRVQAAAKGLVYGAFGASHDTVFSENLPFQEAFMRECSLMVGGFYWSTTRPEAGTFNFRFSDGLAQLAQDHSLLFRGHPLLWNQANPEWLLARLEDPTITRGEAGALMGDHIQTLVRRYAGKVHSWDVVNEGIAPDNGRADGLAVTPWLKSVGEDYIEQAFWLAANADPNAILVYNEARLDYDIPDCETRRLSVLRLLERLKNKGVPVHALGVQAHLAGHERERINPKRVQQFLRDVADLGLYIFISELDVKDTELVADIDERDRIVAGVYEDYLTTVLQEQAVKSIITWGLSDAYSWYSAVAPRLDGLPLRPLPLDAKLQRKMAWNAIARAFSQAPSREPMPNSLIQQQAAQFVSPGGRSSYTGFFSVER